MASAVILINEAWGRVDENFDGEIEEADTDISAPLNILGYLTIDASGEKLTSEQGDGVITLNEILCY